MGLASWAIWILIAAVAIIEVDLETVRILFFDFGAWFAAIAIDEGIASNQPTNCTRLRGPIGAEDGVLLPGDPPVLIAGELDAAVHEFTTIAQHGTSAATAPSGALWAVDRLSSPVPRLTRLAVPLPDGVTMLHTHGLALLGDTLFAVNHAFHGGGERIERWRISRLTDADGPPVQLMHLGAITGHDGDVDGKDAWTFTARLNGAINAVAPVGPHEVFLTQVHTHG